MVQDQLVEYIDSQLKEGVSAETLKATLVGAGWQAVDVDDTMKKVQMTATVSAAAAMSAQTATFAQATAPATKVQPAAQPQVIRVSDLVSSAAKPATVQVSQAKPMQVASAKTDAVMARIATGAAAGSTISSSARPTSAAGNMSGGVVKKSHAIEAETILGILMVVFGIAAAFFFFENSKLSGQIASLNGTSGGVSSQLTALQAQVDASTTALDAQIASTTADHDALALELSFFALPPGTPATTTFTAALAGTVSGGGKYSYMITTAHGAKIYVANSKDVNVIALLKSLVGTATSTLASVQFSGNYIPGSDAITLTAVNGVSTTPPPVIPATVTTSTATSSATGLMIPATTTTPYRGNNKKAVR
jgi:hypothetical protein